MTNLFSIFDPSNSMNLSMNWMSTILIFMLTPMKLWLIPSRLNSSWLIMFNKLSKTLNSLMKNSNQIKLFIVSIFTLIMLNNLMSLMPFIFPSSSHPAFSLSMSMPLWLSIMIYSMFKNPIKSLAHLVPNDSPILISPFLVLIEMISNMIRPITLSIRLSTNITAGHLIMELLGNAENKMMIMKSALMIQLTITILELMMAFIQTYVFSILVSLYLKETY
uniref:ATP synthase subunit a n=1 Tax=Elateroidea sp. 2 KM-2017 TaxID=2219425 RepID=A0A346RG84_9COLE|nr:ATP synthase F0 subunit 6 [Elateroidea sp. 2 KM-2017]